jgi:hypothetical protein
VCRGGESPLSVSPDKRFRIVLGDGESERFFIRDDSAAGAVVATEQNFSFAEAASFEDATAEWSPNGQMVIIQMPRAMYWSHEGHTVVLRWNGKRFTEMRLPKDAIPRRWTDSNQLVCSVRVVATLQLTPNKQTFARGADHPAKTK